MKKILSFVLCMVMAFGFVGGVIPDISPIDVSITAEAAAAAEIKTPYNYKLLDENEQLAYKKIRSAVLECKSKVKINAYLDDDQLNRVALMLMVCDPLTFNFQWFGEKSSRSSDTTILELEYYYSKETYDKMMVKVNKKADAILAKVTEDMSTYNKLKLFHDELIKMNTYDKEVKHCDNIYGAFVTNEIKCVGYTVGFSYLCNRAGIKNTQAYSGDFLDGGEGHIWNKVYYNKKWYNIDCTFDDPITNYANNLSYDNFMISDKAIKKIHGEKEVTFYFKTPSATDDTKSYYAVTKTLVSDSTETTAMLTKSIASAIKNKKTSATIKFADSTSYKQLEKMINNNDDKMYDILTAANKNSGSESKIIDEYYQCYLDPLSYTVTIYFFYPNTKLSKYYADTSEVSSSSLEYLREYGIK